MTSLKRFLFLSHFTVLFSSVKVETEMKWNSVLAETEVFFFKRKITRLYSQAQRLSTMRNMKPEYP